MKEKRIAFIFVLPHPKRGEQSVERDHIGATLGFSDTRIRPHDQRFDWRAERIGGRIHGEILVNLMQALEQRLIETMIQNYSARYQRNGHQSKPRNLKCSLGRIAYRFAQFRDRQSGCSVMPLVQALAIPAYEQYLDEALEPGIGLTVHVSYRRANSEVERIAGQSMSHTTVHSRLQKLARSHEPFGSMKDRAFRFLVVDGPRFTYKGRWAKT